MLIISGIFMNLTSKPIVQHAESLSIWREDSYDDFDKGNSTNITIIGTGAEAKLNLSLNTTFAWIDQMPGNNPPPRRKHGVSSIFGTDNIIIFGGNDTSIELNDTWLYDLGDNIWTEINTPYDIHIREQFELAPVWDTKKVVLFGGIYYNHSQSKRIYLNDTWVFDFDTKTWTEKHPPVTPDARAGFGMTFVYNDDKVLLFGGTSETDNELQDTWIYDLGDNEWTEINTAIKPPKRNFHDLASVYNDDKIVLFGGKNYLLDTYFNDTWVYDVSEERWSPKNPANKPRDRAVHAMDAIYGTDKIVLHGGGIGAPSTRANETWIYDLKNNTWTQQFPVPHPSKRSYHDIAAVHGTNKMILFSIRGDDEEESNRTYAAEIQIFYEKNGTHISNPLKIDIESTLKQIDWTMDTPPGTEIKLQLRTAVTELGLALQDFIGPDGTKDTYYTIPGTTIWSGHVGSRWLQYKAYLSTSDNSITPTLHNVTITYNNWPVTQLINPINRTISSDNTPIFSWTFDDSDSTQQTEFQVLISNNITFQNINFDSGEQTSGNAQWQFPDGTSYSELPDGTWYWKVRTKDNDGDWGEFSETFKLIIDTTAPRSNITHPIDGGFYTKLDKITGTAFEPTNLAGINRTEIQIKRLSDDTTWDGSAWSSQNTWLDTEGTTNWSYNSSEVLWSSGEKYSVQARAIDNLTNIEPYINLNVFTIDRDAPKSWIVTPGNNSFVNKVNMIYGSTSDNNGSGIDRVEISIKPDEKSEYWDGVKWLYEEVWLSVEGSDQWSFNAEYVPWVTDTNYTIQSRAIDNTGNIEDPGSRNYFMFDNQTPEDLSISIDKITISLNDFVLKLSLDASDTGSKLHQMTIKINDNPWGAFEPFSNSKTIILPSISDNPKIYFNVSDRAGNIADSVSITITSGLISDVLDSDNDDVPDENDAFPNDPAASVDDDGDNFPDVWNPGMSEENSTTGLILDRFPNDQDNDGVMDDLDAFPNDPAASVDSDGDKYPDRWNPGMGKEDSTTNLTLDAYPNDPDRWKESHGINFVIIMLIIMFIIIILLLVITKVTSFVRKRKRTREKYPYTENKTLNEVRHEILLGKEMRLIEYSDDKIKELLEEKFQAGKISEDTYEFIDKDFLCSDKKLEDQTGKEEEIGIDKLRS